MGAALRSVTAAQLWATAALTDPFWTLSLHSLHLPGNYSLLTLTPSNPNPSLNPTLTLILLGHFHSTHFIYPVTTSLLISAPPSFISPLISMCEILRIFSFPLISQPAFIVCLSLCLALPHVSRMYHLYMANR